MLELINLEYQNYEKYFKLSKIIVVYSNAVERTLILKKQTRNILIVV